MALKLRKWRVPSSKSTRVLPRHTDPKRERRGERIRQYLSPSPNLRVFPSPPQSKDQDRQECLSYLRRVSLSLRPSFEFTLYAKTSLVKCHSKTTFSA